MTRGLNALRRALQAEDFEAARVVADELDVAVGPHIAFEERCFYPALKQMLGGQFVAQLYREHGCARRALEGLAALTPGAPPSAADKATINQAVDVALEHAHSCGTLVSHVDRIDPSEQDRLLARLKEFRELGMRWSDLPTRAPDEVNS